MPIAEPNLGYFQYVDDNAVHWSVKGEIAGAATGVDGHATVSTDPAWGRMTRLRHVRYAEYTDLTTRRKYRAIIYTPTAYAAISPGDTVTVYIQGDATGIVYTLSRKIPEKQPVPSAGFHLADHA
jgi:hypothetical protein